MKVNDLCIHISCLLTKLFTLYIKGVNGALLHLS